MVEFSVVFISCEIHWRGAASKVQISQVIERITPARSAHCPNIDQSQHPPGRATDQNIHKLGTFLFVEISLGRPTYVLSMNLKRNQVWPFLNQNINKVCYVIGFGQTFLILTRQAGSNCQGKPWSLCLVWAKMFTIYIWEE